jgi:uncharacterized membrane protein
MTLRIRHFWETLRSTLWFVPGAMLLGSVVLALTMVGLDERFGPVADSLGILYAGSADGAREVLAVIAGSMVSVAAVTFSITTVTLTVASQQYGSRLLRNFMRDTGTQLVLGTFIGTFTYSLLVLRSVYGSDAEMELIPHLSVTVGVGLAVLSLCVLIYYIHHVASSIQAGNVAHSVAVDLYHAIDRMYPERLGEPPPEPVRRLEDVLPDDFDERSTPVTARKTGYVQLIDQDLLIRIAAKSDLILVMNRRPGNFVTEGACLLRGWPTERLSPDCQNSIRSAVAIGEETTPLQDVEHGFEQLVQIAVRALSPGVNDPYTASVCIDRIGAALKRMAGRQIPSPYRSDESGKVRVVARGMEFPEVAATAFNQIRQNSRANPSIKIRLLMAIRNAMEATQREEDREALLLHAAMIGEDTEQIAEERDRRAVREAMQEALGTLADVRRAGPAVKRP